MFENKDQFKQSQNLALKYCDVSFPNKIATASQREIAVMASAIFIKAVLQKESKGNAVIVVDYLIKRLGLMEHAKKELMKVAKDISESMGTKE